ncbi:MAG: hypothetical protein J3R72DRAFT_439553 [Linnemannia gamsii]|nr:MAG: hypothetical protein J3R72DRAFT_439553 [Linnemannia gamsii]
MLIVTIQQLLLLVLATLLPTLAKSAIVPDSTAFSDLLTALDAATVKLDMAPVLPPIPNIFVPMTYSPNAAGNQGNNINDSNNMVPPPTGGNSPAAAKQLLPDNGGKVFDGYHHLLEIDDPDSEGQLLRECMTNRAPKLPTSFTPALGVVRLFANPSYKNEVGVVKGCGCMTLHEPESVQSFVGSRNHSFAFFTERGCRGTPAFQRFGLHYNLGLSDPIESIMIVQGVLSPVPART